MHSHDPVAVEAGEHPDYPRTDVPTLGTVAIVAEAMHQLGEGPGGAGHLPTRLPDGRREPEAGQGRRHDVVSVGRVATVRDGVGKRADDVHELDDGAGVTVTDDQGQRAGLGRTDVQEVYVLPVDLRGVLRELVELRLLPAPVEAVGPVVGEILEVAERDAAA